MWPVTARYLAAVRAPHDKVPTVATHKNLVTGQTTTLDVEGGSVSINAAARIRRSLTLNVPAVQATWDLLDTVGGEISVSRALRYTDGSTESVPLGVFVVDQDRIGYGSDGTIELTCPDRWIKVQRNQFGLARSSVPSNAAWQEIQRLVEACWSGSYPFPGWSQLDTSATTKVGSVVWDDGDRDAAISKLCTDNTLEVFFDPRGQAVLRPVPQLTVNSLPIWTVDAGPNGVLITADRTRDRSSVHNAVIVTTDATDVIFPPQWVPQTIAGDPLSVSGPLGTVPYAYSSPTLRNSAQARAAGKTILSRQLGVAKQLTLTAGPNDALDGDDVIKAVLPRIDRNTSRPAELHIIDTLTVPLVAADSQNIQTRSTRPDTDGT